MNSILRAVKGSTKSSVENMVRDATKNEPNAATTSELMALANITFSKDPKEYEDLTYALTKRLEHYTCPQHIYKALIVVRYLLLNGDPRFINDIRQCSVLHELMSYHFYSKNEEIGHDIRVKTQSIIDLLSNNEQLREERKSARAALQKIIGFSAQEMYATPTAHNRDFTRFGQDDEQSHHPQQEPNLEHQSNYGQQNIFINKSNTPNNNNNNTQTDDNRTSLQVEPLPGHVVSGLHDMNNNNNNNNTNDHANQNMFMNNNVAAKGGYNQFQQPQQQQLQQQQYPAQQQRSTHNEQGFVQSYGTIAPECVSTPRKKYRNVGEVNVSQDIQGDMFLMCSPREDNNANDPFADLKFDKPFFDDIFEDIGLDAIKEDDHLHHPPQTSSNQHQHHHQSSPQQQSQSSQQQFQPGVVPVIMNTSSQRSTTSTNSNQRRPSTASLQQQQQQQQQQAPSPQLQPSQPQNYPRFTSRGRSSVTSTTSETSVNTQSLQLHVDGNNNNNDDNNEGWENNEAWAQFSPYNANGNKQGGSFFNQPHQQQQQQQQQQPRPGSSSISLVDHFGSLQLHAQQDPQQQQQQQQQQNFDAFANLPFSNDNPMLVMSPGGEERRSSSTTFNPKQLSSKPNNYDVASPLDSLELPF